MLSKFLLTTKRAPSVRAVLLVPVVRVSSGVHLAFLLVDVTSQVPTSLSRTFISDGACVMGNEATTIRTQPATHQNRPVCAFNTQTFSSKCNIFIAQINCTVKKQQGENRLD